MNKKLKRFLPKKCKQYIDIITIDEIIEHQILEMYSFGKSMIIISPCETKLIGNKEFTNLGETDLYCEIDEDQIKTLEIK